MKKPLAALLVVPAAVAALAVPAGAAVPQKPANQTVPCNDDSGHSARLWRKPGSLAADNPCATQWLDIALGPSYGSSAPDTMLELAPGAHFNWSKKRDAKWTGSESIDWARLAGGNSCSDETYVLWVYSYKDVRDPAVADPARCG